MVWGSTMTGSRRKFLRDSIGAASAAALTRPSSSAASTDQVAGANDRIRIGLIGCGGMGRSDLRDFVKVKNVDCVALCDVDDAQVAKAQTEILDPEPVGKKAELTTRDFRHVLDRKDIDAEKPLSLCIAEGRAMVTAARKHNRVVQMGTQQRSATHYTDAVDYVKGGKLGRIRLVRAWAYLDWKGRTPVVPDEPVPPGVDYDMWLGPAPAR